MRSARRITGSRCWPDERQRLLLGAAWWGDDRALSAWDRWRAQVAREQVTAAETRLLATAYRPLRRLGVDDPMLSLAGGAYRRAWYLNQLALRRAAAVVSELRAAAIEVVVLKGAALALLHYGDVGARPMDDIDLLVEPHLLDRAVAALGAVGWRVLETQGRNGPLRYGTHVVGPHDDEIDVHAYALMQSADDRDLWESRVPLELMGSTTSAPGPEDHLVQVCAHGLRWDETATVRWAADAMAIMASAGADLDWERVVERTQARRLTIAVSRALEWLRESLAADVPGWALRRLRAGPRLPFERVVHDVTMRPPTAFGFVVLSFGRYRRFAQLAPLDHRPRSFARYLRAAWDLDTSAQLLIHGGQKLAGRAR